MWAYAAHPRGIFPFTRKDTKGVSKGTPLRYPWGLCPRSNRKRSRAPLFYRRKFREKKRKYPRGHLLLDTLLLAFLVKEKSVPVWAARAHETKRLMKLSLEEEAERFYTLLQSFVSLPLRISTSSILHWGSREGATPSLCRRSRNQKVPCVSLPTFFTQERMCGRGVHNPTSAKYLV